MINIKYDADAKHDFKHPHCELKWKDTFTFEVEYAIAILLDVIFKNDKDSKYDKVLKEIEVMYNEIKENRKEKENEGK